MMPLRYLSLVGCLALAGACAAPGASPERHPSLLGAHSAAAGRGCAPMDEPRDLPAATEVVDSAALAADLAALAGEGTAGHALVSLELDANGWNSRRDVIEHSLAPAVADSLQQLVFAHRRTVPAGEPWGVRLRIDFPGPHLQIGRRELCPGYPRDSRLLRGPAGLWDVTEPSPSTTRPRTVWVRALVDARGYVVEMEPAGGGVGLLSQQDRLASLLRTVTFEPARIDGLPVASWIRTPIVVP